MSANIFQLIESELDNLSRVEKTIANSILDSPNTYIRRTMAEISKSINVSEGSINNFAKKFTGGGYTELKLRIAADLSEYTKKPFTTIEPSSGAKAAMQAIICSYIESIIDADGNKHHFKLNQIVNLHNINE